MPSAIAIAIDVACATDAELADAVAELAEAVAEVAESDADVADADALFA